MSALNENLKNAFQQHRVVFWYDATGESQEQYEDVELDDVEKVTVNHNAFALKHKILRQEKSKKILIYFPYERPGNENNWLLDIDLSYCIFDTEQTALNLHEMELDYRYKRSVKDQYGLFG